MSLLAAVLAFFVGSIPFGVLIGKMRGVDVRIVGSGNIGATNVWRALGPKYGALAFALDVAKGVAGPFLAWALVPDEAWAAALCGVAALLGHVFSPFLGFKGGKGIATGLGALVALIPLPALCAFAFWGVVLAITRMISAASMAACVALPILCVLFEVPAPFGIVASFMALVAFWKHLPNLKRIAAGVEPKVGQKKVA